jgi:RNA polymerase sigma-70 factor, ECF subfamily
LEVLPEELIRRARGGDPRAFATLVEQHQQFVYNLALRVMGDEQEAEAFVRAWMALPNFRGQSSFATWMYRIVINLCYNRLPGLRRELANLGEATLEEMTDESIPFADPAESLEVQERRSFLHGQIDSLPAQYRLLIGLRYQQEMSYEQIASMVSLPLGTVKTGLFRAKAQLREAMRIFEEEPL